MVEKLEKNGRGLNLTEEVRDGILCHTRGREAFTPEGRIVRLADRIAYINHDIDDAERAGVLRDGDIPQEIVRVVGRTCSARINAMVFSAVENSKEGNICLSPQMQQAVDALNDFMFSSVYLNPFAKREEKKVPGLIEGLYAYLKKPEHCPEDMRPIAEAEGYERAACDYIAGMTDHYAVELYSSLFIPHSWNVGTFR